MFADPQSTRFVLSLPPGWFSPGCSLGLAIFLTVGIGSLALVSHADAPSHIETSDAGAWVLEKEADGISVYTRPVVGSSIKEFKSEGIVGIEIEAIVALLRDAARFKDWFPNTSESKLLAREGALSYQYSVMSTPWPIADRDNVFLSVLTRDESTGRVEITVDAAPDAHPVAPGRHRVTRAKGSWRLTPKGADETHVEFTMHLEPGGGIPTWLVNARIVATPFEALVNLRRILAGSRNP